MERFYTTMRTKVGSFMKIAPARTPNGYGDRTTNCSERVVRIINRILQRQEPLSLEPSPVLFHRLYDQIIFFCAWGQWDDRNRAEHGILGRTRLGVMH